MLKRAENRPAVAKDPTQLRDNAQMVAAWFLWVDRAEALRSVARVLLMPRAFIPRSFSSPTAVLYRCDVQDCCWD